MKIHGLIDSLSILLNCQSISVEIWNDTKTPIEYEFPEISQVKKFRKNINPYSLKVIEIVYSF